MLKSLRSRLTASYLLVIVLAMAVAAGLAWTVLDRAFLDVLRENLLAQARRVAQMVELEMDAVTVPQSEESAPSEGLVDGLSYYAQITEQPGFVAFEFHGEALSVTTSFTAELPSRMIDYSQLGAFAANYETRVLDANGAILLELRGGVSQVTLAREYPPIEWVAGDYSQTSNVLAGYHARIIDEEGVVIVDSPDLGWLESIESPSVNYRLGYDSVSSASLSDAQMEKLQANLGIPPDGLAESERVSTPLLGRPEVQSAFAGNPATEVRTYEWAPSRRVLYAAYPVYSPRGTVTSISYIASPLPRLSLDLLPDYFGPQVLGGSAVAMLLAGAAGFLLARSLTRPLGRLKEAASALARGERTPPVPPASTEELSSLGAAFNTMNTNLTTAQGALAAHAQQREAILHGLADAVLAADANGEIILANPAAASLLQVAAEPLQEAIAQALKHGEPLATEVAARDRVIELLTTSLRDEEGGISGVVAVGHDVTAYRQLDRLRTGFVSDVSHELRTPLTAIKGFIETLQEGGVDDPMTRSRFLDTVASETDRLIRLTNDLLLLTRADADQLELQLSPTDLAASVGRAVAQLEGSASEKQIATTINTQGGPVLVRGDADRIHQVLVNLLDNAIKFTPAGGRVSVSIGQVDRMISCSVADTGPGVPAEEIPHLFGRFYRGDPSRARLGGNGAGLGLAIAKAIVEAHGGSLWVEREPGRGASFTFTLPAAP